MKTLIKISALIFLLTVPYLEKVEATVGGATTLYDFKYNPKDESVYYIKISDDGRGCSPMLEKISLNTEKSVIIFNCQEGWEMTREQVDSKLGEMTKGLKPLSALHLKNNDISIDVSFVKPETYGSESDEVLRRHFNVSLYQYGEKIKEFPITGCALGQPFVFSGYSIPGFDKKIVILSSAKRDCAEGGYVYENLYIVGGVDRLDKTAVGNVVKDSSALVPNEGSLVVYEADKVSVSPTSTTTPEVTRNTHNQSFFERLILWLKNLL